MNSKQWQQLGGSKIENGTEQSPSVVELTRSWQPARPCRISGRHPVRGPPVPHSRQALLPNLQLFSPLRLACLTVQ